MSKVLKLNNQETAPIVALHSSASSSAQWNSLIADVSDRNEVFAFDLPGYAKGLNRDIAHKGMERIASPLIREIEKLDTPVHLVGHSFGGATAIKIAMLRHDLIKSLSLYEPVVFHLLNNTSATDQCLLSQIQSIETVLRTATYEGRPEDGMKAFVDFWNGPGTWETMPEKVQQKLATQCETVSDDFTSAFSEKWDSSALAGLNIPSLMLMGMDSPLVAQRVSALIARSIPNAELAMLPDQGHMAPITAPNWINPRITQHIARVEKSASPVSWNHKSAA